MPKALTVLPGVLTSCVGFALMNEDRACKGIPVAVVRSAKIAWERGQSLDECKTWMHTCIQLEQFHV